MSDKSDYRELCGSEPALPLHAKDWWLDAVCGPEDWDVALVRRDKEIVASLPYYTLDVLGTQQIIMPRITQMLGPFIRYPDKQKYANRLGFEKKIMNELIDALPQYDYFGEFFHTSITNWLPFMWKGFTQTTHYTYVLDDLTDLDAVFADFKNTVRTDIRKAGSQVEVRRGGSVEDLYRLVEKTWNRQDLSVPISQGFLQRVDDALCKHESREIFLAVDTEGRHHSGLYLTWDANSAYTQLIGDDTELRGSAAGKLVIWEAIQFVAQELRLPRFDFLGSIVEGIETVRRSFGARQVPFFMVRHDRRSFSQRMLQKVAVRLRPGLIGARSD